MNLQMISVIGMPLLLAVGGVATWWASRKESMVGKPGNPGDTWRDTSLDDWRRERDAGLEAERAGRLAKTGGKPGDAGVGQEQEETKRHQRIGG